MTIFILPIIGLVCLVITGVIIAVDNRKRKYRKKKLTMPWKLTGIFFTVISFTCFIMFAKYTFHFQGEECGERKILLRSTMQLTDVRLPSGNPTLDATLADGYGKVVKAAGGKTEKEEIVYIDALLNKKRVPLSEIHEIKYSDDLSEKQVQIVEYLVNTKDGRFTKPGIFYYLIFSTDLGADKQATDENVKDKKETQKDH